MRLALDEAGRAGADVPVGAVVLSPDGTTVLAAGHNEREAGGDPTVQSRVDRVVYGARDEKAGAAGSLWDVVRDRRLNHRPEVVGGVLADACARLLTEFFRDR